MGELTILEMHEAIASFITDLLPVLPEERRVREAEAGSAP